MPTTTVDGQELHYEDSGGDGSPVLFAHGFLMDHTMFDRQVEALADDFRCVRFDARGFGRTPAEGPFDYWDLAEDAVGLLDELGIESAVVCGMSQGGFLALRAALRHPDRVRALVLIDTAAGAGDAESRAGYRQTFDTWRDRGPVDPLVDELADRILGDDRELRRVWIGKWKEKPFDEFRHAVDCLLERDDVTARLGEIDVPALIVHGEEDVSIPMEEARRLDEGLSGSVGILTVPGAAHAPNLSHPEAVNPRLREFLERHV